MGEPTEREAKKNSAPAEAEKAPDQAQEQAASPQRAGSDKIWNRVPMTLLANYTEVPVDSQKGTPQRTTSGVMLYGIKQQSLSPFEAVTSPAYGAVTGVGAQQVDTLHVPVARDNVGTGLVSESIRYVSSVRAGVTTTVHVANAKDRKRANSEAQKFVGERIQRMGDLDELATATKDHLTSKGIEVLEVEVKPNEVQQTPELGQTNFGYRIRDSGEEGAVVLLDFKARPNGEKHVEVSRETTEHDEQQDGQDAQIAVNGGGSTSSVKTAGSSSHHEEDHDDVDAHYERKLEEVSNEIVTKMEGFKGTFVDHIVDDVTKHQTVEGSRTITKKSGDITIHALDDEKKSHKEVEDKPKSNFFSKVKKVTSVAEDVLKLPVINKLKYVRKLSPWFLGLDVVDSVAGKLQATGTVHVEDVKDTDKLGESTVGHGKSTETQDEHSTTDGHEYGTHDIRREVEGATSSVWQNFKHSLSTETQNLSRHQTKTSSGIANGTSATETTSSSHNVNVGVQTKHDSQKGKSARLMFNSNTVTKYFKPEVEAAVVSGDCEVSAGVFPAPSKK